MTFYDKLAPLYDEMTNFSERIESEQIVFKKIFEKFPANSILDAACGTGLHSITFSLLNKKVIGFDPSNDMLECATKNAIGYKVTPKFIKADFFYFSKKIKDKFDSIYCLGNSFVHLLTYDEQHSALINFKNALSEKGYLCIQILNYDKILHLRQSRVSKKKYKSYTFNRYYTFNEKTVNFKIDIEHPTDSFQISTELYPLTSEELGRLAESAGFSKIQIFGNMNFGDYRKHESENICAFISI